jgi:hypothetical protein
VQALCAANTKLTPYVPFKLHVSMAAQQLLHSSAQIYLMQNVTNLAVFFVTFV